MDEKVFLVRYRLGWNVTPSMVTALQKLRQGKRVLEVTVTPGSMKVEQLTLPDYLDRR